MTSTLVVDADEAPQYIEGLVGVVNEGARHGRWNGLSIPQGGTIFSMIWYTKPFENWN